ncbi:winged helix-turn-helix domain-containing protein [Saccharothrix lopnurensis]|uniref:Winged helix-turn-helix domain-containing protein n=1 Tax=Saccharothrix lopnurensis TaxID=1670621 RepID=A0ABW1P3C5_9PSEU
MTNVEVTIAIRLSAAPSRAVEDAERLADALRAALDLPEAEVVVGSPVRELPVRELPGRRAEPALRVLVDSRRVLRRGRSVELTRLEFDLLHHLCTHPRQVHRRAALMNTVWGGTSTVDTRTVDVHVRRLRRKLGDAASFITTVRGVGYRVEGTADVVVERDALAG